MICEKRREKMKNVQISDDMNVGERDKEKRKLRNSRYIIDK